MKLLLTGASGYIGKRLLPMLLQDGHEIICCVRDKSRFNPKLASDPQISLYEVDFLDEISLDSAPKDFDAAFYLIHSMSSSIEDFMEMEKESAENFRKLIDNSNAKHIIYLSGISNEKSLSPHLKSRKNVEEILKLSKAETTILRAGIIVGSGSASFEIIRSLVEKLPAMTAPKWLKTRCQPIAIRDVIKYLKECLLRQECFGRTFDIGGPDILSYKEMLTEYAKARGLKRLIITLPVMTPRLSSYWLYFITPVPYKLAVNLVNSMKAEVVCKDNSLEQILGIKPQSYHEALKAALDKLDHNLLASSWKDALITSSSLGSLGEFINTPEHGCFIDSRQVELKIDWQDVVDNIWSIGGKRGWYYGNFLWKIRGFIDRMAGGAGLRRGRTDDKDIYPGGALDFWRVLIADNENARLLLYAEMRLPGEAWLEFKVVPKKGGHILEQTATFRPDGLLGRLYWYALSPFHYFIFAGMARNIASYREGDS